MLRKPITEDREFVSLMGDAAIVHIPSERLQKYARTRNVKDLGDLPDNVTIFRFSPLLSEYRHLADLPHPDAWWRLFAGHLRRVIDSGNEMPLQRAEVEGKMILHDVHRGREFSAELIQEAAAFIKETGSRDGELLPFTPPAELSQAIWRARALAQDMDKSASTETANDPSGE